MGQITESFWKGDIGLFIHPKKTEYVIFRTAAKRNQINFDSLSGVYLGDQVLNCRPFYKYLGVYLDQILSFKEHVTRLVNKVSRQLGLLSRLKKQSYTPCCRKDLYSYDTS